MHLDISFHWSLQNVRSGIIESRGEGKNLFVNLGRTAVVDYLVGDNTVGITYFAVGSGTTTPTTADTTLGTEVARIVIANKQENPQHSAELTAFANTSQLNGAHTEVGLFGEGATASAGSGVLFAKALATFTKTSTQTLTYVWRFAITGS